MPKSTSFGRHNPYVFANIFINSFDDSSHPIYYHIVENNLHSYHVWHKHPLFPKHRKEAYCHPFCNKHRMNNTRPLVKIILFCVFYYLFKRINLLIWNILFFSLSFNSLFSYSSSLTSLLNASVSYASIFIPGTCNSQYTTSIL